MAITPRTIFSSAAPATVAAVSLLAFTAVGTVAYMSSQDCPSMRQARVIHQPNATSACGNLRQALGADKSRWSEGDWIHYATCFEQNDNSKLASQAASQGLKYYPRSEPLFNVKGYHQIVLDKHEEAVGTLETGLERIGNPYSGVLENNLAWAALWAPREMPVDRMRTLYTNALDKEPNVCAYLHTGLWVEYAMARQSSGVERFEALRKFDNLRSRYEPCLNRLERGDWQTLVEITGAGAMFDDLEHSGDNPSAGASQVSGDELLTRVAELLQERHDNVSVDSLCSEAMPISTTHQTCVEEMNQAMAQAAHREVRQRNSDARPAGTSGSGGPCPAMVQ